MLVGASRQVLETLKVQPTKAADFEIFWQTTLFTKLETNTSPVLVDHATPMKNVIVKDVTVSGFNGDPIKGWFLESTSAAEQTPCIIMYDG